MTRVAVLGALVVFGASCGPPCTPVKHAMYAVPTFGIYNLACRDTANEQEARDRAMLDVARCVEQGGDPAACRAAVYGTLAPRTNVNVNVR